MNISDMSNDELTALQDSIKGTLQRRYQEKLEAAYSRYLALLDEFQIKPDELAKFIDSKMMESFEKKQDAFHERQMKESLKRAEAHLSRRPC